MGPWMGLLVWFVILLTGSTIGGVVSSRDAKLGALTTQLIFLLLGVLVFAFFGGFQYYGLKIEVFHTLISLPAAIAISLPLSLLASRISQEYGEIEVPFNFGEFSAFEFAALFLILAPLGEEILFRGVLETPFLIYGALFATMISALLFAFIHILPFKHSPAKFLAVILLSAFILGLLAGYLRAISGSLLPAFCVHLIFNLSGKIVEKMQMSPEN